MFEGSFTGRVAIVTGAGGGLGRSYALELARRGASVVVNDLSRATDVVQEIAQAGGRAVASEASVATRDGGRRIVETALTEFGRVDILISNAGNLRHARFDEMTDKDIDDVIDVHLKGGFYVAQPAFKVMKQQGYGRILFTASASGVFGHPWQASYGAAKAGLVGLANVVALEGQDHGVLCNALMPTARTNMANEVGFDWAREVKSAGGALQKLMNRPSGGGDRLDPNWTMPLALFLVSESSTETHGVFSSCSGRYARVIIGVGPGWIADAMPSVENIAAHLPQITSAVSLREPHSVYDEALLVREALSQPEAAD